MICLGVRQPPAQKDALSLWIAILCLGFFLSSMALAADTYCPRALDENDGSPSWPAQLSPISRVFAIQEIKKYSLDSVMELTGRSTEGLYGGRLRELKSPSGIWNSGYADNHQNILSSPLILPILLGPRLAFLLGYRKQDPTHLSVPDAKEVNGFLEEVSRRWKAKDSTSPRSIWDSFHFFTTKSSRPLGARAFITEFISGRWPLEETGTTGAHDANLHVASFLLPPDILDHYRKAIQFTLFCLDKISAAQTPEAKLLLSHKEQVLELMSERVDMIANLIPNFANAVVSPQEFGGQVLHQRLGEEIEFLRLYQSPEEIAEFYIYSATGKSYLRFIHNIAQESPWSLEARQRFSPPDPQGGLIKYLTQRVFARIQELQSLFPAP